nr:O-antigen ligase family protein [Butyricimonas sp. DFI.6.44]
MVLHHTKKITYQICFACGLCIILAGLYLTHSRAAWLALISGIIWIYFKQNKYSRRQLNKKRIFTCISITFLTLLFLGGIYLIRPESANGRVLIYLVSLSIFRQSPWFGHGVSSFEAMYMPQQALWFHQYPNSIFISIADNNYIAFNEYIKIACETGIIGLILFSTLIFYCFKVSPEKNDNIRYYQALLISLSTFSMLGYPFENISITFIFCIIIAILAKEATLKRYTIYISKLTKKILASILLITLFLFYNQVVWRIKAEQALKIAITEKSWVKYYTQLLNSPDFILWLAEELYSCKKYNEALPVLEQACKLRPNSIILNSLGLCYQRNQRFNKAQNAFQQASLMVPSHILPQFYLFSLYQETGEKDKAEKIAKTALTTKVKITNTTVLRARHIMKSFLKNSDNKTKERRFYEIDASKNNEN